MKLFYDLLNCFLVFPQEKQKKKNTEAVQAVAQVNAPKRVPTAVRTKTEVVVEADQEVEVDQVVVVEVVREVEVTALIVALVLFTATTKVNHLQDHIRVINVRTEIHQSSRLDTV
jgi:hypothetical protein